MKCLIMRDQSECMELFQIVPSTSSSLLELSLLSISCSFTHTHRGS